MNPRVAAHLEQCLSHLYINPLEKCNLRCKICYTKKTSPILSSSQILSFVERYQQSLSLQTITFCGGEVFALSYFPSLLNTLTDQGLFVQVITNGTLDELAKLHHPNLINLIVSLDGLPQYHDSNRGEGNFQKSLAYVRRAHELGFHTEIFSIVTRQNLPMIDSFEQYLKDYLGFAIPVTYHPRKPPAYLLHHPVSNVVGEVQGFDFLTDDEMITVMQTRNVFPPKDLGCYQIALVSNGKVFGCCEGVIPIGHMDDDIETLRLAMYQRIEVWERHNTAASCLGCTQSEFMCGIKKYIEKLDSSQKTSQTQVQH